MFNCAGYLVHSICEWISDFISFCLGIAAFNLNCNTLKVNLTDNRNAHINKENFNEIVEKFESSASFYVNLDVIEENVNMPIVSVKVSSCIEFVYEKL